MKPISLTMEAFGPYRDSVTLDFNELQDHSMFLIAGPTGAGKTSILDAMVYALISPLLLAMHNIVLNGYRNRW